MVPPTHLLRHPPPPPQTAAPADRNGSGSLGHWKRKSGRSGCHCLRILASRASHLHHLHHLNHLNHLNDLSALSLSLSCALSLSLCLSFSLCLSLSLSLAWCSSPSPRVQRKTEGGQNDHLIFFHHVSQFLRASHYSTTGLQGSKQIPRTGSDDMEHCQPRVSGFDQLAKQPAQIQRDLACSAAGDQWANVSA